MQIYNFKYQTRIILMKTTPYLKIVSVIAWHAKSFLYNKARGSSRCSKINDTQGSHLQAPFIYLAYSFCLKHTEQQYVKNVIKASFRPLTLKNIEYFIACSCTKSTYWQMLGSLAHFHCTKLKGTSLMHSTYVDLSPQHPSVLSRGHPWPCLAGSILSHF